MRQFGCRQLVDPPPSPVPLPDYVHKYNRKGTSKSAQWWLQRVSPYVADWGTATERLWPDDEEFDPQEFDAYLTRHLTGTRLSIIPASDPDELPAPTMHDMYPSQSITTSR